MPRYYKYRRSYVKKVYPRKRWCSNLKSGTLVLTLPTTGTSANGTYDVCSNSANGAVPNPVIVKFGRFKIKGDVRYSSSIAGSITSGMLYVVFVPEGNVLNYDLIQYHPEYILGWTYLSMDSGNSFTITSPLKRNLNSGDKISMYFAVDTTTTPAQDTAFGFFFTFQYWTTSS
ncbi:putative capsid protein [Porcine serum associated circular DNA virus 1]|nr:putative capsid protein [Porcine serum associated circular DNA virus 1]